MSDPIVIEAQSEDDPYTMANLRPAFTGLPMVVWVSERGNAQHDVRLKVCCMHGDTIQYNNTASVGVVICLDERGPRKAKSHPGRQLVRPAALKAKPARQEIDYRRRGVAGYVFGAFQPASGQAFTNLMSAARRPTGSIA